MPNEKNLKPFGQGHRTPEEELGIQRRGGNNSGISRRKARSLKESAQLLLSLPVQDKRKLSQMLKRGVPADDADNMMLLVYTAFHYAIKGNPRWGKMLFDLLDKDDAQGGDDLGGSPLEAFLAATSEDMDTSDLPEVQ